MNYNKLTNYLENAQVNAKNSHDTKTQVGAILVHKKTGAILAQGYNGFVRGALDHTLPNGDDDAKHEYMIHAEANLICNSSRHGIRAEGCMVVQTLSPCKQCIRLLWNAGIDTIYFPQENIYKDFESSIKMGDLKVSLEYINNFIKLNLAAKREI